MVAAQLGGADAGGGGEFLQRVEQGFDGGGLRGIGDGFGEPPLAVHAVGANFQRAGRNDLDAGDGGQPQFRQNGGRFRAAGRRKRSKINISANSAAAIANQIPVVFEFIIFSGPARPGSRTAAPRRATPPATTSGLRVVGSGSSTAGIP